MARWRGAPGAPCLLLALCVCTRVLGAAAEQADGAGAQARAVCAVKDVAYTEEDVHGVEFNNKHDLLDLYYPASVVRAGAGECGPGSAWADAAHTGDSSRTIEDLFRPEARALPLIVLWHAGGWLDRSKEAYAAVGEVWAAALPAVVAVANYPLTPRITPDRGPYFHPVHVNGAALAVKWLLEQHRFPFDLNNVIIGGHCAGGTFAGQMLLGPYLRDVGIDPFARIRGYYSFEGIFDVPQLSQDYRQYATWFLNIVFGEDANNRWHEASPTHLADTSGLKDCAQPSWLIIHSTEDKMVNTRQAEDFAAHLEDLGFCDITAEYGAYGRHMDPVDFVGSDADVVTPIVSSWLAQTVAATAASGRSDAAPVDRENGPSVGGVGEQRQRELAQQMGAHDVL